jgi:hypothetical protein
MRVVTLLASSLLALVATSAASAQYRVYSSKPAVTPAPFQVADARALGRTLSGRPLESSSGSTRSFVITDSTRRVLRTCPMPVLTPDTTRLERMRVLPADTSARASMPIVKPDCSNPLRH